MRAIAFFLRCLNPSDSKKLTQFVMNEKTNKTSQEQTFAFFYGQRITGYRSKVSMLGFRDIVELFHLITTNNVGPKVYVWNSN